MGKLHRLDGLVRHVRNQAPCPVLIETGTFPVLPGVLAGPHERSAGLEHTVLIDDRVFGTSPSSPWPVGDADTLITLPSWIQTADVAVPRDPFAEARPVAG